MRRTDSERKKTSINLPPTRVFSCGSLQSTYSICVPSTFKYFNFAGKSISSARAGGAVGAACSPFETEYLLNTLSPPIFAHKSTNTKHPSVSWMCNETRWEYEIQSVMKRGAYSWAQKNQHVCFYTFILTHVNLIHAHITVFSSI